ncbi:MAG: hypothetical protein ABJO05_13795 [Roseibium sp.]
MADIKFNRDEVEAWLKTQPREVSVVIAARAALRVLPLLSGALKRTRNVESAVILPTFRATALLWAASNGPAQSRALLKSNAATNAAASARAAARASTNAAATDAAYAAYSAFAREAINATAAANTVAAAAFAVFAAAATAAVLSDQLHIKAGRSVASLAGTPLWHDQGTPHEIARSWNRLREALLARDEGWDVWTDWYDDRLQGRPANPDLEVARVTLPEELWEEGPAAVNARIRELIEEYEPPEEPKGEPGQRADVQDGVLVLTGKLPKADERSDELQRSLHELVRKKARDLHASLTPLQNQYPELDKVVTAYLKSVDVPLVQLEVPNVWSEGNDLDGLAEAYSKQDIDRTLSEPLEPEIAGKLASLLPDHSGFILGFELGRLLTERADRMRRNGELSESLRRPVLEILSAFRRLRDTVEAETREFIEFTEDVVIQAGWPTGRVAYSAYALTRTLLLGCGRFLIHKGVPALGVFGGVAALAQVGGDPQLIAVQQFALLFRDHAGAILQFAAGFPELRRWLAHIVDQFDLDSAK